jgi:hypothetical protein
MISADIHKLYNITNLAQNPSIGGTPAIVAIPILNQKILVGTCIYSCKSVKNLMLSFLKFNRALKVVIAAIIYVTLYIIANVPIIKSIISAA